MLVTLRMRETQRSPDFEVVVSMRKFLGTMSLKQVKGLSPEASASFWDMVCVALMSSGRVSMNQMKIQSSQLISSGSGCAKPGGQSLLVCSDCDSGTSSMCTQR